MAALQYACGLALALLLPSVLAAANFVQCPGTIPNPLVLKGKRFFDTLSGRYFPVKGVAYYPRPNDGPLSVGFSVDYFTDEFRDLWKADIEQMKELGVNTVRIYAVDPSKNHDEFMCTLQLAGIYVIVGLLADCEGCAVGPNEAPFCYPASLKERGQYIMNEFSKYANTLAFSAGNEVTLYARDEQIELNAACQKKFLRDMRAYVETCSSTPNTILPRKVPIGMVNWDFERDLQTLYFNCQTDPSDPLELPEWYGLNAYQQCDPFATSTSDLEGWINLRDDFARYDLPIPVLVAEYGCRERFPTIGDFEAQRTWLQVDALYSEEYQEVFAGGVVFEYSAEKYVIDFSPQDNPWPYNEFMKFNYGLGYYTPIDCDHDKIPCQYEQYPEFQLLRSKLDAVDVSFLPLEEEYLPIFGAQSSCPASMLPPITDFVWPVDDEPDLPCYVVPTPFPTAQPTPVSQNTNQISAATSLRRYTLAAVNSGMISALLLASTLIPNLLAID